jgi:hypothetical protein
VNKWRSIRIRSYVLPVLLAALALQFLIPHVFMTDAGDGTSKSSLMCSLDGKSESIKIPAESAKPHCDNCLMPSLGPARPPFNIASRLEVSKPPRLPSHVSQIPEAPLVRAQIARAPPPHA